MTPEAFGRLTSRQAVKLAVNANRIKMRDDRRFLTNLGSIMGHKVDFQPIEGPQNKENSHETIEKSRFASDDLSDEQKKHVDIITQQALARKQLEMKQRENKQTGEQK
jgi:hypothetical protein